MSERFDVSAWYASMREADQDVLAVELVEHDLQLVVAGRTYDPARDERRWAAITDHRTAVIAFLCIRDREQAA